MPHFANDGRTPKEIAVSWWHSSVDMLEFGDKARVIALGIAARRRMPRRRHEARGAGEYLPNPIVAVWPEKKSRV
ncbi:hypothetical protein [Bradyrhizobium sp. ORS 375]|uniref:hypothetical protein n=1 Tax=Bradyrhizobium sp. (strain ORS 375) TaxID=566679 RepID=UPI001111C3E8|nr:hypothetical protein [Bradyrhizobium sp. ORS 375]